MKAALPLAAALLLSTTAHAATPEQTAAAALARSPVWDGHNDVPEQLRGRTGDVLAGFDFRDTATTGDTTNGKAAMQTDLARLRKGKVGAQFWSVYVDFRLPEDTAVRQTLEQIDTAKRLIARYPEELQYADSAAGVEAAWKKGRIASLLGMEGGGSVAGSLAVLRQMYALGVRYLTLAHYKDIAWADSSNGTGTNGGLTPFGRDVVREMQRLGMLVDLSHTSADTMMDALETARAPVMFSHSSARAVGGHPRNVPDEVLDKLKLNGGIVMVTAVSNFISEPLRQYLATRAGEKARLESLHLGYPDRAKAALDEWDKGHPAPPVPITVLADHVDHIVKRIGIDHVGVGMDFDGTSDLPQGMTDVSMYPNLFVELARRGYSQGDLEKIASRNMLRVMRGAEAYAAAHRSDPPIEAKVKD